MSVFDWFLAGLSVLPYPALTGGIELVALYLRNGKFESIGNSAILTPERERFIATPRKAMSTGFAFLSGVIAYVGLFAGGAG